MSQVYSKEGFRRLRTAWIVLAASVAAAIAIIGGTYAYLEKEKHDAAGSERQMREARSRLDNIRRESDSLEESATIFRTMLARGLMQPERRLDLVELMNSLRARHHVASVEYEIAPQRPLALSGNRSFPAVDILASRVTLKARALHEGDLIDFIDGLGESQQGFHTVDRCVLRRIEGTSAALLQPRVEAECSLEWITMKEKRDA